MFMKKTLLSLAVCAGMSGAALAAMPAQLIINGDFENGTLAGWTMNNTAATLGDDNVFSVIANGDIDRRPAARRPRCSPAAALSSPSPTRTTPGAAELRQGFTVAPGTNRLFLSFDWFNNDHNGGQDGTSLDGFEQVGRVDILAAGAAPLATDASAVLLSLILNGGTTTPSGDTIPWSSSIVRALGLGLGAGSYELRFGNSACCSNQEFGVDNVSLLAIPEPGSLALAALGIAGIVGTRRRRA